MRHSHALGALNTIHQLLTQLVADLPAQDSNRRFHPDLPGMGWLLGRSVYLELWWLREKILGDNDLSQRVRGIFTPAPPTPEQQHALPPKDHLLNWALEIQEQHLTWLANPKTLPEHPWLHNGWLTEYLLQNHARIYEQMLAVKLARMAALSPAYPVSNPLQSAPPCADSVEISQGHYRVGARDGVVFDNEQPMQMVEMRNFRICRQPVDNAAWLAFIEAGGYWEEQYWSEAGRHWRTSTHSRHPWLWRQDDQGHWYAIGLNGPQPLLPEQAVTGICAHEADAFAAWAATQLDDFRGAILPHEFHWESAARIGALENAGRVWEWCSNSFEAYSDYEKPVDTEMAESAFDGRHRALRGGCIHTQPSLRRISIRHAALPGASGLFSGLRLVLPPALEEEALYVQQWQKFLSPG